MRKLFWGCTICGVTLAGGVVATTWYAVHAPRSVIGEILHRASDAALRFNPITGLTPIARQMTASHSDAPQQQATADAVQEDQLVPPDPTPVEDGPPAVSCEDTGKPNEPGPIVVANGGTPPIVIPESQPPGIIPPPPNSPVEPSSYSSVECPVDDAPAAPPTMPSCTEEESCELLPMPAPMVEVLPMPHEEEQESGCAHAEKTTFLEIIKRCWQEQSHKMIEMMKPAAAAPAEERPKPEASPCDVKDSTKPEEQSASATSNSVRRKFAIFRHDSDEATPRHPEVDTMEYRASDRSLDDYGPGPL
jgi:hypothetical protein